MQKASWTTNTEPFRPVITEDLIRACVLYASSTSKAILSCNLDVIPTPAGTRLHTVPEHVGPSGHNQGVVPRQPKAILLFHWSLTTFFSLHRMDITLVWSPVNRERGQDTAARHKSLEACALTPRASLNRVQSAAYQQITRMWAFTNWAKEWHEQWRKRYGGDSFAYEYALTKPPSGLNHPLWKAAVDKTDGITCFSRHTTTTALRLTVGHMFTSDCARRFRPDIPEEENHCACGFPDHSFHQILYDCPRHTEARHSAGGHRELDDESLLYYFHNFHSSRQLLDFLQISRAAFLPPQRTERLLNRDDYVDHPRPSAFGSTPPVTP